MQRMYEKAARTVGQVRLRGTPEERRLMDLQRMYEKAARTVGQVQTDGGAEYSLNPKFATAFDNWMMNGAKWGNVPLEVGRTSDALRSIGVQDNAIYWDTKKIQRTMIEHPEMSANILKQVPDIIERPIIVMQSKQKQSRITMFGEVYDTAGTPVLAVLELEPIGRNGELQMDTIKLVSTYGKDNTQGLINSSDILYLDPNKKRTDTWLALNRLQLPFIPTKYGSIKNISYSGQNSNPLGQNPAPKFQGLARQREYREAVERGDLVRAQELLQEKAASRRNMTAEERRQKTPDLGWDRAVFAEDAGQTAYSMETLPDGRRYVKADRPVIEGDDPAQWSRQAEQFINEKIRNGEDLRVYTPDGFAIDITERSAYKLSDSHVQSIRKVGRAQLDEAALAAKMRAAGHIDELAETAKWRNWRADENGNHQNDIGEDGFDYFTSYFEDADGQYYEVRFSAGVNRETDVQINGDTDTAYSIGVMNKRRHPSSTGSSNSPFGSGAHSLRAVRALPTPPLGAALILGCLLRAVYHRWERMATPPGKTPLI